MSTLVRDALLAHLPPRSRRTIITGGSKYTFNCPACRHMGHGPDTRQRGAVFINHDGSTGYDCFNCQLRTRQKPYAYLAHKMEQVLGYMGMAQEELVKLRFNVSAEIHRIEQGRPDLTITKRNLPSGAILIKHLRDNPPDDPNYRDVMAEIEDMSEEIRDSYYWTPEPGESGDMNRRYIWFFGTEDDPVGWAANSIEPDTDPILSDPNIFFYGEDND